VLKILAVLGKATWALCYNEHVIHESSGEPRPEELGCQFLFYLLKPKIEKY